MSNPWGKGGENMSINPHIKGYTLVTTADGNYQAINESTGEIHDVEQTFVIKGSVIVPPEQQEEEREALMRKIEYWKRKQQRELRKTRNLPLGNFFFVVSDADFSDIMPEVIAKLVYLSTYMDYNNQLMLTQRTPMKYNDLSVVLGVSNATVWRFWNAVSPKYIYKDKEGGLYVNGKIFKRGKMQTKEYVMWQQCYINGIRTLYKALDMRNHKHFGYLFKLLPYVNVEHNILCWNPWEEDLDKIKPMTLFEFCEEIGYDYSHLDELLSIYRSMRFEVNGKHERFFAIVYDGRYRINARMFVNPRIMYNGNNYINVQNLGIFCS